MRIAVHDYAGHPFQVDLSRELARRGHTVWHLYFAGDKGPKGAMERVADDPAGFNILPISIGRDYSKSNFLSRRSNDQRYGRAVAEQILALKPDVVLSGNTPLDAQGAIIAATHKVGATFVNWIQDFYGLAIERLLAPKWFGVGALVGAYYRRMERRQLARTDAVVLISEDFRRYLTGFEDRPERVAVIPNWGAIEGIPLRPKDNPWSRTHGLADRFVFLYSGTLGLKHNPASLVALADAFADHPEVCVVVAAAGVGRVALEATLLKAPRENLRLLPLQSFADFPDVLAAADSLVAVLEEEAGEFSVPSKILSYLCAGRPIILAAPVTNAASQMLGDTGAGIAVPSNDTASFLAAAVRLFGDPAARTRMGAAGRNHAEMQFSIERVAERFEGVLEPGCRERKLSRRSVL